MQQNLTKYANRLSWYFLVVIALVPFHAFLTTWIGSNAGHLDLWRIWKEVAVVLAAPVVLYLGFRNISTRTWLLRSALIKLIGAYIVLHLVLGAWALQTGRVNMEALIYALLINLRFLGFFVLVVILARMSPVLRQHWWKAVVVPCGIVAIFGLLQVFVLPHDFLRHFGYGPDTIPAYQTVDNKLEYQRVQSTLRGANPLGAYLVLMIALATAWFLNSRKRVWQGIGGIAVLLLALFFTYSRSAYIGTLLALGVLGLVKLRTKVALKYIALALGCLTIVSGATIYVLRDQDFVQNTLFHSDETSVSAESSNEKRASALQGGVDDVVDEPLGRGPGTAGPASMRNDHPSRIAENYYLQIGQEVGWLGLGIFVAIQSYIAARLWRNRTEWLHMALLASLVGLTFVNFVSHAWTDDTLAYVWWGLCGVAYAATISSKMAKITR